MAESLESSLNKLVIKSILTNTLKKLKVTIKGSLS